ncbi:MAG: fumarylacetoacetate hydrolase family protein [Alphaproteobacteria bacterium]|nr:fumarylacetoacetate hydrolase family protein [Alphaproteobacteria bacterium]
MRLISYRNGEAIGVMVDETGFVALAEAAPDLPGSLKALLATDDGLARAGDAVAGKPAGHSIDDVTLDPVIKDPGAIWCAALNYAAHQEEVGRGRSEYPEIFLRTPASVVGHGQPLVAPYGPGVTRYDFEGELVAVIGKGGRFIAEGEALSHVAGYAVGNEGSVRDYQRHNRQYGIGKNFEASGSVGPWLMTADEFGDPYKQSIITRSGGVEKQHCSIGLMLAKVEEIIAYASKGHHFQPGDMIFTGTPASLPGTAKLMQPGDTVEIEITGLGTLVNPVVKGEPA